MKNLKSNALRQIALELDGIEKDEMSKAEKKIAKHLIELEFGEWDAVSDSPEFFNVPTNVRKMSKTKTKRDKDVFDVNGIGDDSFRDRVRRMLTECLRFEESLKETDTSGNESATDFHDLGMTYQHLLLNLGDIQSRVTSLMLERYNRVAEESLL